jgi:hypothetical protein
MERCRVAVEPVTGQQEKLSGGIGTEPVSVPRGVGVPGVQRSLSGSFTHLKSLLIDTAREHSTLQSV